MSETRVTIGVAAQLLGVSTKTLRHYQRLGLLSDRQRGANGYRSFGAADLLRAQQIRRLQSLGLSLGQVQALLGAPDAEPSLRAALTQLAAEVEAQITQLEARRALIARLLAGDPQQLMEQPLAPSPSAQLIDAALGDLGAEASPWLRDADAYLLSQLDTVLGSDPAYRAQVQELARLAAAQPAAYRELVTLGQRLEGLRDADPAAPEVADLAAAYRHALAANVILRAAVELPPLDGLAAALLGDLLGMTAPTVLSVAQLRVFELAGTTTQTDDPSATTG